MLLASFVDDNAKNMNKVLGSSEVKPVHNIIRGEVSS